MDAIDGRVVEVRRRVQNAVKTQAQLLPCLLILLLLVNFLEYFYEDFSGHVLISTDNCHERPQNIFKVYLYIR